MTMSKIHDPMESEQETRKLAGMPGLRHTVWDQQDIKPEYPKIEKDESTDVVIVGGGIFGLSIAYNLVKEGQKVIVLEAKARGKLLTFLIGSLRENL